MAELPASIVPRESSSLWSKSSSPDFELPVLPLEPDPPLPEPPEPVVELAFEPVDEDALKPALPVGE